MDECPAETAQVVRTVTTACMAKAVKIDSLESATNSVLWRLVVVLKESEAVPAEVQVTRRSDLPEELVQQAFQRVFVESRLGLWIKLGS